MANNEDEDILDSEHLGTVLAFPSAVQEAIDQVFASISFHFLHEYGVKTKQVFNIAILSLYLFSNTGSKWKQGYVDKKDTFGKWCITQWIINIKFVDYLKLQKYW